MHNEQQVGSTVVELSTLSKALNAEPIWGPFERAPKAKGKSTSAKGRIAAEDVTPTKIPGKDAYEECTQAGGRATIREWTPASEEAGVDTYTSTNRLSENPVCRKLGFREDYF